MAEANEAYAKGNAAKLAAILDDWHSSPEAVDGVGVASELVRALRKIHQVERRLGELRGAISEVRQLALFRLMEDATAAQEKGRDLLAEMAAELTQQTMTLRTRLAEIPVR